MQITKLGHCCLLIEHEGVRLLTDPGSFTAQEQQKVSGLHGILITHEHADHLHVESLKALMAGNPTAVVVGNSAVAKLVGEQVADAAVTVVGDGQSTDVSGVLIEGFGKEHALVYPPDTGLVENTGYFVAENFISPATVFTTPASRSTCWRSRSRARG